MEAKHTATPWRAECWTSHAPRTVLVDDPQAFTGKCVVAECESDEDAAFIVRACNAHDDLVSSALDVLEGLEGMTLPGAMPKRVEKLRAALSRVGAA